MRALKWSSPSSRMLGFAALALVGAVILAAGAAVCQDWPQEFTTPEATIVMYEPQVQSYDGDNLAATAAVSIKTPSMDSPTFGAVWINARVSTDRDARIVTLLDTQVSNIKFPGATGASAANLSAIVEREIPKWDLTFSLEGLKASLDAARREEAAAGALDGSPPKIVFVTYPAVLITVDGDPDIEQAENSSLEYVANTPFFIIHDPATELYYLKGGQYWYESRQVTSGWRATADVPPDVADLAESSSVQSQAMDSTFAGSDVAPVVIVTLEPADLIVSDGAPQYAPIAGTNLLYMTNTEGDVIMDIGSQQYYVLLAGRWYTGGSLTGDRWSYVRPNDLPADFARIPPDSEMGDVLASVSGTDEAKDAMLDQQVPQTAEVDRNAATVDVTYDGDPEFARIEGTDMSYGVNTDYDLVLIGGRYYCCDHAVWFVSDYPTGPWSVCVSVPDDIYGIPPSCPLYNIKYVYVYGYTPDIVYVGYTPGYLWSFMHDGCIVYGTGYHYRGGYRHHYYPRPWTYGFGAHYSPFTGWGFSFGLSYGWLGVGWSRPFYYDWWGPGGYRFGYRHGFARTHHHDFGDWRFRDAHPGFRAPFYTQTTRHFETANVYRHRMSGVLRTGEFLGGQPRPGTGRVVTSIRRPPEGRREVVSPPVREGRPTMRNEGRTRTGQPGQPEGRPTTRPEGRQELRRPPAPPEPGRRKTEAVPEVAPNNIFTDKNGAIYRKTAQEWQMRDRNRWLPTEKSAKPAVRETYESNRQELQQQYENRQRETVKTRQFQAWQNRGQGGHSASPLPVPQPVERAPQAQREDRPQPQPVQAQPEYRQAPEQGRQSQPSEQKRSSGGGGDGGRRR
jgi:hypothetical protein